MFGEAQDDGFARGMDTWMTGGADVEGEGFARVGRERVMCNRGERIEKVKGKEKGEGREISSCYLNY